MDVLLQGPVRQQFGVQAHVETPESIREVQRGGRLNSLYECTYLLRQVALLVGAVARAREQEEAGRGDAARVVRPVGALGASCRRGLRRGEASRSFCVSSRSAAGAHLPPTRLKRMKTVSFYGVGGIRCPPGAPRRALALTVPPA